MLAASVVNSRRWRVTVIGRRVSERSAVRYCCGVSGGICLAAASASSVCTSRSNCRSGNARSRAASMSRMAAAFSVGVRLVSSDVDSESGANEARRDAASELTDTGVRAVRVEPSRCSSAVPDAELRG